MREIFDAAGHRATRLVATAAGHPLYEAEGFRATGTVSQFQGIASAQAVLSDKRVRPARAGEWPAIAALDAEAFGGDRSSLLDALKREGAAFVLEEAGIITGFSVCRAFGRGQLVGPLVAGDAKAAVALACPHVIAHAGAFLRLDTPEQEGPLVDFLEASGLRNVDHGIQMTQGTSPPVGPARTFALASQALG
jgi:hypothetical protein